MLMGGEKKLRNFAFLYRNVRHFVSLPSTVCLKRKPGDGSAIASRMHKLSVGPSQLPVGVCC